LGLNLIKKAIPGFAVNIGASTSIDITREGIDKAYAIRKLRDRLQIPVNDMLFLGDALYEGGNDYPARATGAECIQVRDPEETKKSLQRSSPASGDQSAACGRIAVEKKLHHDKKTGHSLMLLSPMFQIVNESVRLSDSLAIIGMIGA
jgi:hypothetical protein